MYNESAPSSPQQPFYPAAGLRAVLVQGSVSTGGLNLKTDCLTATHNHLEAASNTLQGAQPTTAILSLEYALLQLGNAIALIFRRSIEARPSSSGGTHDLGARAVVEFCKQRHPELVGDATLAYPLVTRRNQYMYRHAPVDDAEVKRLGRAVLKLYTALREEIMSYTGFELDR